MRIFDLFMRRAGVDRAGVGRAATPVARRANSRLTVVCPREALAALRWQIYLDFKTAGLNVSQVKVDQGEDPCLASVCITVDCPADMRGVLMSQAKLLGARPDVRHVHFGDVGRAAA